MSSTPSSSSKTILPELSKFCKSQTFIPQHAMLCKNRVKRKSQILNELILNKPITK